MLETPAIARVLYSESFRAQLSGIYVDEAHTVYESVSWRPSYTRLHLLRKIIGNDVPIIPLSATLPTIYRNVLKEHLGLKPDYRLINLGNFCPELSVIVACMEHDVNSFKDLTFVLPSHSTLHSIPQTLIYSDNLNTLTEMFWWFQERLQTLRLPQYYVEILHAGLSEDHQKLGTQDFIDKRARILLGSDKIGAGMDFPNVQLVVQYRCRDLTLVKWEQRRGRGARREGLSAVGVILVEKSMTGDSDDLSTASPKFEDPALLDLIHSSDCLELVVDKHLENPPRHPISPCLTRCSNCNPQLFLHRDLIWITEDPGMERSPIEQPKPKSRPVPTQAERESILKSLTEWRFEIWKDEWMDAWPMYAPESLIRDSDLDEVAKRAHTISSVETLISYFHTPHEDKLALPLFTKLTHLILKICGPFPVSDPPNPTMLISNTSNTSNTPPIDQPSISGSINHPAHQPVQVSTPRENIEGEPPKKRQRRGGRVPKLREGETLIDLN